MEYLSPILVTYSLMAASAAGAILGGAFWLGIVLARIAAQKEIRGFPVESPCITGNDRLISSHHPNGDDPGPVSGHARIYHAVSPESFQSNR